MGEWRKRVRSSATLQIGRPDPHILRYTQPQLNLAVGL